MSRQPKPDMPAPVVLTPEQMAMAARIVAIGDAVEKLKEDHAKALRALKAELPKCKSHVWKLPKRAKYERYGSDRWFICESVYCAVCEVYGGWVCQVNLIRPCEYAADDTLCDSCIHCGLPDERK